MTSCSIVKFVKIIVTRICRANKLIRINYSPRVAMCLRLYAILLSILILPEIHAIYPFNEDTLPLRISRKLDDYWQTYKTQFNKTYTGNLENTRRTAWEQNLVEIYKHNLMAAAGHHSYTLRDNHIADLNTRQYIRNMVKLIPSQRRRLPTEPMVSAVLQNPHSVPRRLDWREYGFVTSPVNQQDCGSCYAYSIAESIQGQIFKQTGMLLPLSAQQLIDCSTATGNRGCVGGSLRNTLKYLEKSKGLMAGYLYPYNAEQGMCRFQKDLSVVNITSWAILPARDEKALEAAVATIGPVAASINASPKTFQLYHKGVYDDYLCSSDTVNHAMLIVGYTPTEWILKNWWGDNWGENGYMRLAKNKNRCGIANYAAYVKV
ncbi:cathepsin 8 [Polyergus mexicanus]|uniref:cathepsin 8 n=1 Tax=Polyergus mexicanus TaxID=615972 RepID=UPI0038B59BEF